MARIITGLLLIVQGIYCFFGSSDVSLLEGSVCTWNYDSSTCYQDPQKMIDMLTDTEIGFAYMMRCSYASTQEMCDSLNTTCIWAENSCRVEANYLFSQLFVCTNCTNDAQVINSSLDYEDSWIDRSQSDHIFKGCSFVSSLYRVLFPTCAILEDMLGCYQERSTDTYLSYDNSFFFPEKACTSFTRQEHTFGLQVMEDVAYLLDKNTRYNYKALLKEKFLEEDLGLAKDNLKLYDDCQYINTISKCESESPETAFSGISYNTNEKDKNGKGVEAVIIIIPIVMVAVTICGCCVLCNRGSCAGQQGASAQTNQSRDVEMTDTNGAVVTEAVVGGTASTGAMEGMPVQGDTTATAAAGETGSNGPEGAQQVLETIDNVQGSVENILVLIECCGGCS